MHVTPLTHITQLNEPYLSSLQTIIIQEFWIRDYFQ